MWDAVPPLLAQAEADDAVRLVVFSGAGEKAFVSGADISQFEDQRAAKEAVKHYEPLAEDALMAIYDFPKPTLACIRGWCIGGGVNVAISCDIRIAASDSVFAIPAARLGLGYRYSALKNLVDLIGVGRGQGPVLHRAPHRCRRGAAPGPGDASWRSRSCRPCWPSTPQTSRQTRR